MTQYKQTKRRFSPEFKLEAIEQVVKYQQHAVEVARALELDPNMLRKWVRQYEAETRGITPTGAALTPEQRRIQALRIITGGDQQLRSTFVPPFAPDKLWHQLIDNGRYHGVQIGDFVM